MTAPDQVVGFADATRSGTVVSVPVISVMVVNTTDNGVVLEEHDRENVQIKRNAIKWSCHCGDGVNVAGATRLT